MLMWMEPATMLPSSAVSAFLCSLVLSSAGCGAVLCFPVLSSGGCGGVAALMLVLSCAL